MTRPGLVAITLVCLMTACGLSNAEEATVERWLLCEDCLAGELDSVLAIHKDALVDVLGRALQGPPPDRIENVRRQARATYATMLRFTPGPAPLTLPGIQAYTNHFATTYIATYETRAVVALDSIGTPRARTVLMIALLRDSLYAPVVRRALGAALQVQARKFAGDTQVAAPNSPVAIPPAVEVRGGVPTAPLAGVRVLFTVAPGNGRVADSIQFTNTLGVATVGSWNLGPGVGSKTLRAIAAGQAVVFRAFAGNPPVAFVELAPATASLAVGDTVQLVATLRDSAGHVLTGRVVTWSSSNPARATVTVLGLVTAVDTGFANITAMSEGKLDTTAVTVH